MLLFRLKQKPLSSIPIEIPILWPRAVMVCPRLLVLLTPPLTTVYVTMQLGSIVYMLCLEKLRGSTVIIVIGYALWSDSRPEHPDWLWNVPGAFYTEVRRPEREAGAEIKN